EWNGNEIASEVKATLDMMGEAGITVLNLDDGDRENWVAAVQPVYDGQDDDLKALIDAAR
ncbi:MAG: hypothetical protein AAF580_15520, partial [Pseudomonadota bacterium]